MVALGFSMEDHEAVDYSSDRLESNDIWAVTGGGSLELLVETPRLGLGDQGPIDKLLGLADFPSPPVFPVSSPVTQVPAVASDF